MARLVSGEVVQTEVEHYHKKGHSFPIFVVSQILKLGDTEYILCFHQDLSKQKQTENELKRHRDNLKKLVEEQTKELNAAIEELKSKNEESFEKNRIINDQNEELKETLKNLQETQTKLIQAEKMASIGVLTSGVAHEVNNPLNFIQSSVYRLEALIKGAKQNDQLEQMNEMLVIIKEGVRRTTEIVRALNTISKKEVGVKKEFDIHQVIVECLQTLAVNANNYKISKEFTQEYFLFSGIKESIRQVIIHLLNNAIQAVNNNGVISIGTKLSKKNRKLEIIISDNGVGIDKEHLTKIFDPFFTTKGVGEGKGLGLSISYIIVKEHDGNIFVSSEVGHGSTFVVELPVKLQKD